VSRVSLKNRHHNPKCIHNILHTKPTVCRGNARINSISYWQFTHPVTWIQDSSLNRTSVVSITPSCTPSNNLWVYTTRNTYIDQYSTPPLTIHRSISTLRPLDIYVSCRRPDTTLSYMAQNLEPSRCIYNSMFAWRSYKRNLCRCIFDYYYIPPYVLKKTKRWRSLSSTKFKSENSSIQVRELQPTTVNANILVPKTELGMVYVLLIPKGKQESSEQKSNPTFLMNTLLVLQTCGSTSVFSCFLLTA
jgi:hypothetical protein